MKTNTKFALAALTAVLFATGTALADDNGWLVLDNHHGSLTYLRRPTTTTEVQTQPTVGIFHHGTGIGHRSHRVQRNDQRQTLQQVTTSQGTVSYFAPAE